jgi:hypothetical protein
LWQNGRWSSGDLPSYQSRRTHVAEIIDPLIEALRFSDSKPVVAEPTGWAKVDRIMGKARVDLAGARNEEDFQLVGVLCREALISLVEVALDPARHPVGEGVSPTDFKARIEAFIVAELPGGSVEDQRRHARAAFDLANNLQHKRTAGFRVAALCLEATASVINLIAIASGRRDPI